MSVVNVIVVDQDVVLSSQVTPTLTVYCVSGARPLRT